MKLSNLYQKFYNSRGLSSKYTKVDDYLFRGPHPKISDLIELKKEGVTQIYDFRHKGIRGFKFIEKFLCQELGIKYIRYPFSYLEGRYPTTQEFDNIARSVKLNGENGGKTLFHCNSGSHRTAHMSAYYELTRGEPIENVFNNTDIIRYTSRMQEILNKHFYKQNYFNRKFKNEKTLNPIQYLKNKFNNKVIKATERAHASFISIITRFKDW